MDWPGNARITVKSSSIQKRLEFCKELIRKSGKETALSYIRSRVQGALAYEFLHLKYSSDEATVRELTKEYSNIFAKNRGISDVSKILFEK